MLHVHHKQYIKGRKAWEYEIDNFEALCAMCHKATHNQKERLDSVIAQFPSDMYAVLSDLLVGFGEEYVDPSNWIGADGDTAQSGRLAFWLLGNIKQNEPKEVADAFIRIGPDDFMDAIRSAVLKRAGP